jgi:hypothetical protein
MTAVLVVDALNMAAWVRRGVDIDGVICHSDAGLALRPVTACLRRPELAFPATGSLQFVAVDARMPSTLVPSRARSSAG